MNPNAQTMARHYRQAFLLSSRPSKAAGPVNVSYIASMAETRGWVATDKLAHWEVDNAECWGRKKLLGCQEQCRQVGLSPVRDLARPHHQFTTSHII